MGNAHYSTDVELLLAEHHIYSHRRIFVIFSRAFKRLYSIYGNMQLCKYGPSTQIISPLRHIYYTKIDTTLAKYQ